MAASRDLIDDVRPSSQHRPSSGNVAGSGAGVAARPHAHSISLGAMNPTYRVNRRKSSSSMAGLNVGALAAAAREAPLDAYGRIKTEHGETLGRSPLSRTSGLDANGARVGKESKGSSALVDGPPLSAMTEKTTKARGRRASEGARRVERRRSTATGELRCEKCGKGYKHGSCLQKHKWEHTPEWALTSKLLISKHQQVQLLEAAQVLVNMNTEPSKDGLTVTESAIQESESSDSPAASGMSDAHDDDGSSRTSTPSQHEDKYKPSRQDSYPHAYSRSYQSTSGHSLGPSSAPHDASDLYYYRQAAPGRRLSFASSHPESDDQDLTAAAESLLSCSLGTPKTGAAHLPPDVPPVPPLPAQFVQQTSRPTSYGYQADAEMPDGPYAQRRRHVQRHDEDDEGVFGQMEH